MKNKLQTENPPQNAAELFNSVRIYVNDIWEEKISWIKFWNKKEIPESLGRGRNIAKDKQKNLSKTIAIS